MNFLQGHFNQIKKEGGSSIEYEIVNDLDKTMMEELEKGYEAVKKHAPCGGLGFLVVADGIKDCQCWKKFLMQEGRDR